VMQAGGSSSSLLAGSSDWYEFGVDFFYGAN